MKALKALPEVYSEEVVADFLGKKKSTMQKDRSLGVDHPPFKKLGATVVYPVDEFHRWWESKPLHREFGDGGKAGPVPAGPRLKRATDTTSVQVHKRDDLR